MMKKTSLVWFAFLAFLLMGCRNDAFNPADPNNSQQAMKFRVVPASEIPQIINVLQAKTNNFKVPIKKRSSASGKTETVFGEIKTDFIIETRNNDESYYLFSIIPTDDYDGSETYNLEVKTNDANMDEAKVVVYNPTEEWLLNGNNDYSVFSGSKSIYTVDGELETTVAYLNGDGNCKPPEPCPDCPTNPQGPGGGGPPGGGDPPTGPGGPIGYPDTGGGTNGGGGGGCGGYVFSHYTTYTNPMGVTTVTGEVWINGCGQEMTINYKTIIAGKFDCSGSGTGGVITPKIVDPCTKTKGQLGTASLKGVIQDLKNHIANGTGGEKGFGIKKNGTASPTSENSDHTVNFGDPSVLNAGYHNHTGTKVDMFSATDISTLIEIARYNGTSNPTNAFMGLVAPNGIHYVIRFNGTQTSLPVLGSFSDTQKEIWNIEQVVLMSVLLKKNEFTQTVNGKKVLNSKGLEQILFDTLAKMGLKDNVVVQKIDDSNKIFNVVQNSDKSTIPVPCP